MSNSDQYDTDLALIEQESERVSSPEKLAEFHILSHPAIKSAILKRLDDSNLSYKGFHLRKLSFDLATIEISYLSKTTLLKSAAESDIAEIEIEEWLFTLLEMAYLKGHKVGDTPAMPFTLNIPSNASSVIADQDDVEATDSVEEDYLDSLGITNDDKCPVTTLRTTYRRTERRTARGTVVRSGNPPRSDQSRVDGSRADYRQDSMGQDSRCDR